MEQLADSLSTLPSFLLYFVASVILTLIFGIVYTYVTPHREIILIRSGNVSASIVLTGALLGFVIPLASVIANSAKFFDMIVWGAIALIVQIAGFFSTHILFPRLSDAIVKEQLSEAIFLAGLSLALGILTAACMVG